MASAAGGVWFETRRRMRRKLEKLARQRAVENERARIAKDIHDDLGSTLTLITMLSDPMLGRQEVAESNTQSLDRMHTTARELTRAMDEIVWAVNPQHDTVDSLVAGGGSGPALIRALPRFVGTNALDDHGRGMPCEDRQLIVVPRIVMLHPHEAILDFHVRPIARDAGAFLCRAGVAVAISGGRHILPDWPEKVARRLGWSRDVGCGCHRSNSFQHHHAGKWNVVRGGVGNVAFDGWGNGRRVGWLLDWNFGRGCWKTVAWRRIFRTDSFLLSQIRNDRRDRVAPDSHSRRGNEYHCWNFPDAREKILSRRAARPFTHGHHLCRRRGVRARVQRRTLCFSRCDNACRNRLGGGQADNAVLSRHRSRNQT
jgi:hypothetical protein